MSWSHDAHHAEPGLPECEALIARALADQDEDRQHRALGLALGAIRDLGLYRDAGHRSFAAYCAAAPGLAEVLAGAVYRAEDPAKVDGYIAAQVQIIEVAAMIPPRIDEATVRRLLAE